MLNKTISGVVISDATNPQNAVVTPLALAVKLGIDAHADSYVVVRQVDQATPQPAQRFTLEGLLAFARRQVAVAQTVHSCYEAGPFGYVLHRQLTALGVNNVVVRPRDWSTSGERIKTDQRDAAALCSCLDRHLAGNRGALAIVRVPSATEEPTLIANGTPFFGSETNGPKFFTTAPVPMGWVNVGTPTLKASYPSGH